MIDTRFQLPPTDAQLFEDKGKGIHYKKWVDEEDCEHVMGSISKDKNGLWVTIPGLRLEVINGEIDIAVKV